MGRPAAGAGLPEGSHSRHRFYHFVLFLRCPTIGEDTFAEVCTVEYGSCLINLWLINRILSTFNNFIKVQTVYAIFLFSFLPVLL